MLTAIASAGEARAALSYYVEPGGWPNGAHRDAAVAAIQSATARYNAYGDFGNHSVYVYYNAGIPTAQASYLGSIGFGGTYPNERVTMHELAHYLGSGTYGDPWDGARGEALINQFDGLEAQLQGDANHFWPYGLNYDSEGAEINKQRQVALVYAQRADMGIGSTANPSSWAATAVTLKAPDAQGTSGFNYASTWSDNTFAHPNAAYATGAFSMRTPEGYNSWTFVGNSLTVNPGGRLLYNGWGTTGVVTFRNLTVNGGTVRHDQFPQDLFQLAGKVTLVSTATFESANGDIKVLANMGGNGSLTKTGGYALTLTGGNSYTGNTTISSGTLRLAPAVAVASYSFDNVSGSTVVNGGTGGSSMNGTLANGAAIVSGGRSGNAVSLANGASVDINNGIVDLGNTANWTVSAWVKTTTPGATILTKGDGAGWSYGNTIFYLGDGTGQGSGGIPSAVRWAGGFFQGSTSATAVNNNTWHQVTYVNSCGDYAIYVDGAAQPLSLGNSSFSVPDIGWVVRLGVSTNTVPTDGTVNYNGLLDRVQFYRQALSPAQVTALFQGQSVGPLPTTTHVSIASGATLDLNGTVQQIASLSGPAGSAVTLGAGQLTVGSPSGSTQFAGTISGVGGSLVKDGNSTLTLSGTSTYTGNTIVQSGALLVNGSIAGGLTVQAGGTVSPSVGIGSLNVGGNASIAGLLKVEYSASSIDLLNVGGQLNIAAATVDFESLGSLNPTSTYVFVQYDSLVGTRFASVVDQPPTHAINYHYNGNSMALVPDVPANLDRDGDVDADDLALFRPCMSGDGNPHIGGSTCTQADFDGDNDVDQSDFGILQRCFSGSARPVDPSCAN
ncbi:MAG TPA: autotransporter-associated beta strand repeat-containing protein [Phycisphaerae bacterium]|nr:autotransporter-associated beta strand repeat-containing protein [Phycisphaerae bacterium]HRY70083.1 autotransporter-associated beta strand repeat-containing protein [Phycisphaerae bacterium]HSA27359.1 autotransporter-associated beta strand repeat-containing protein [Phycisphaerae bacterium]